MTWCPNSSGSSSGPTATSTTRITAISTSTDSPYRVLDANLNRLREGLRVVEEVARLVRSDPKAAAAVKSLRDDVRRANVLLPRDKLLAARDSAGDPGRDSAGRGEMERADPEALLSANFKRCSEAARVLEEFGKLVLPEFARSAKAIRFKVYDLEKTLLAGSVASGTPPAAEAFAPERYQRMPYRRCGKSGLLLPSVALGLWHSFGDRDDPETMRAILFKAFDLGITHFDLANNYGPPPGAAEGRFGELFRRHFRNHRDELIISSKAGYLMWPGPYGDRGSRKYLLSSLDRSLQRTGLDYFDIFYHHRPDPETPLEETMGALDAAVRSGKALYAGISNYPPDDTQKASALLKRLGTPCLIHQPRYSMLDRKIEEGLLSVLETEGIGCAVFSPLAQGLLTDKYLQGIPAGSRASKENSFLKRERITPELRSLLERLCSLARERGQSMAQMALAWVLRNPGVTSVIIGASSAEQVADCAACTAVPAFSAGELALIDRILSASTGF